MTGEEYQEDSVNIRKRADILRRQIDDIIESGVQPEATVLQPLVDRHQDVIDELWKLDRKFISGL